MLTTRLRLRLTAVVTSLGVLVTGAGLPPAALAQSGVPSAAPVSLVDLALPDDASLATDASLAVNDTPSSDVAPVDTDAAIDDALATADALPEADWEIEALAATLGTDPVAAFRLVRDRIGFEPYPGVLRGAEGTLAARAGNAYDRALLLTALLDAMGVPSRFAFGVLDDAAAARLVARALQPTPAPLPVAGGLAATTFDLDALAARARRDHALLRMAIDDAGLRFGDTLPTADLVGDVRDHAWVQVEQDGSWLDLDPSLPDGDEGQRLAEPTSTSETIPDDAWQTVTLEVIARHVADPAGLTSEVVLQRRLAAASAAGGEVFLYFVPDDGGGGLLSAPSTGAFVPQLLVDREVQVGTTFSATVEGGGASDFFGLGGGGGPVLADLRLRVVREAPGRDALTTELPIIERVPDGIDVGSISAEELLPLATSDAGPAALSAIRHLVVSTGGIDPREEAIARAGALSFVGSGLLDDGAAADYPPGDVLWPIAVADQMVTLASERLLVPALRVPGVVSPLIDRPRLSVFSFGPDPADASRLVTSIDLASDEIRLLASDTADPADLARRQVWYGTLESALETEALLQSARWSVPGGRALVGASLAMGQPLQVLTDPGALPAEASAALRGALETGAAVVVPGDPATAATWWTVDPASGTTRAIVAPGLGGAVASRPRPDARHDVQGGWTPGGGSYVNSVENGVRWVINEQTGASEGYIRDGRFYRYARNAPQARTCANGNEYSTLLGCVSIPTAIAVGAVTSIIVIWAVSRSIRALR